MHHFDTREDVRRAMLARIPTGGTCAEIGVWEGGFSEIILEVTKPKKLHLIDPWEYQPEFRNSAFGRRAHSDTMVDKYQLVKDLFKGNRKVKLHRAYSDAALETFADGELDWVYIDGNHNYEVVSNDLRLCLDKVKADGVIAGDDYFWRAKEGAPVKTAVDEVVAKLGDQCEFDLIGQQYTIFLKRS